MNLEQYRHNFPALANKSYFNYGGQGPLSETALQAIINAYHYIQDHGPFSSGINDWVNQEKMMTREAIAHELKVTPSTIVFTENVTIGCNIALWGLNWQPGDRLLLSDCEHPGIIAIIQELQRRFKIEVSILPLLNTLNSGDPVKVIAESLQTPAKLLVISHILWNTGQLLPLGEIVKLCQANGVKVLVDAAQSVGVLPLDLTELGVDFYAFTGHKWWCGPEGLGGLYISKTARAELAPTFIGWRGIVTDKFAQPTGWKPDSQCYEVATSAYPLYAGLREAIALHNEWGNTVDRYQQICQKSQYLWQLLQELEGVKCLKETAPETGLVSFALTNGKSSHQLVDYLAQQQIMIRTIVNPDCVRACVNYYTLDREIEKLVGAIEQANFS